MTKPQSRRKSGLCRRCRKIAWPSQAAAERAVAQLKRKPNVRKPYLLDWYRCPFECGWHVGHSYRLGWGPLCVGEHK